MFGPAFQRTADPGANRTGLPDGLKSGVEALSGRSFDNVRVYYNSQRPAAINALAYTQGTDIHVAPGQERQLPHEAWHVVQQIQGRVKPTLQLKPGVPVNDDRALEHEADAMGRRALSTLAPRHELPLRPIPPAADAQTAVQRRVGFEFEMGDISTEHWNGAAWVDHRKADVLGRRTGFDLTADEGVGQSQLEIIIRPIDESNPAQVATLVGVTAPAVVAVVNNIGTQSFNNWRQANTIPGTAGSHRDRYRSIVNGAAGIVGQLQMTAGVRMAKLYDHASGAQATNYLATLNPMAVPHDALAHATLNTYTMGPMAGTALAAVNGIPALGALPPGVQRQIAAIAAMMATFPVNIRTSIVPYPKAAAGPLMARTDYSRIMLSLPAAAKAVLTAGMMRTVVIATINHYLVLAGRPGVNAASPVFPPAAAMPPGPVGAMGYGGLTLGTWIGSVVPTPGMFFGYNKGRDLMTQRHYPGTPAQRAGIESMGGYGRRRDPGGKPIVEFRTLNTVGTIDLPGQLQRLIGFLNHP